MKESLFRYYHCARKKTYTRHKAAINVLAKMKRQAQYNSNLNVYKCKYCQNYHIGNKSRD